MHNEQDMYLSTSNPTGPVTVSDRSCPAIATSEPGQPVQARSRALAIYLIAAIVVTGTVIAFIQSYDGLYEWARRYLSDGWARTWPLQVDAWIAVGELALYVGYRDRWPAKKRIWPWVAALTGLAASTAFNVGHMTGVDLAGHLTAAVPPIAAFGGLFIGTQVLKNLGTVPHMPADEQQELPACSSTDLARQILQASPHITGADLANQLGVSERTGRRLRRRLLGADLATSTINEQNPGSESSQVVGNM